MYRIFVRAAGCLVVLLALTAPAAAQTGVLSGAIYDQTNKAGLAGVTVKIPGTELFATTGKDGRFTLEGVPAGVLEIEAIRTGYQPYKLSRLRVVENDTAFVYLALAVASLESATEVAIRTETPLGRVSPNAPLYIVDGVMLGPGSLPDLSPDRIESVEVVKGAAGVSLYGARAANGVIVLRTKR